MLKNPQVRAAVATYGRALVAALATAVALAWMAQPNHDLTTWTSTDAKAFGAAVLGALVKVAWEALRTGNTAFGRGAALAQQDGDQAGPDGGEGA